MVWHGWPLAYNLTFRTVKSKRNSYWHAYCLNGVVSSFHSTVFIIALKFNEPSSGVIESNWALGIRSHKLMVRKRYLLMKNDYNTC
jgi:hypothetical protein